MFAISKCVQWVKWWLTWLLLDSTWLRTSQMSFNWPQLYSNGLKLDSKRAQLGIFGFLWLPLGFLGFPWPLFINLCPSFKIIIKTNQFRILVENVPSFERFHTQLVWIFLYEGVDQNQTTLFSKLNLFCPSIVFTKW